MRVMQKWHNHDFFGVTNWMSTIRNDEIRLSGMATMCKQFDETNYASLSKIKDVIKPIDTSVLSSVKQISSTLPKYNDNEVNHSPCYTVTYSLHSVNSVKLYIYFSSSTWSLLCACFFTLIFVRLSPLNRLLICQVESLLE